jgi:casein kinase 1
MATKNYLGKTVLGDSGRGIFLQKKLGKGAFGVLYLGIQRSNQKQRAIKLENKTIRYPQLYWEHKIYTYMHQGQHDKEKFTGIPRAYYYQTEGPVNILVMDLLGPSLEDLFVLCGKKIGLKSVLMVASQMVERLEYVNRRYFLHRDVKPDNFLMGRYNNDISRVYLIDFGLAKR